MAGGSCSKVNTLTFRFLLHGHYISNELSLQDKSPLIHDYEANINMTTFETSQFNLSNSKEVHVKCEQKNYTKVIFEHSLVDYLTFTQGSTQLKTNIIPNSLSNKLFYQEKGLEQKIVSLMGIIEDMFFVIIPLMLIIIAIFILAKCRKVKHSRTRAILSLRELAPVNIHASSSLEYREVNQSVESDRNILSLV